MKKLGAALAVKPVLLYPVGEPSKHNFGSLLDLNSLRVRGPCTRGVLWHTTCARDAALSQLDLRSPPLLGPLLPLGAIRIHPSG